MTKKIREISPCIIIFVNTRKFLELNLADFSDHILFFSAFFLNLFGYINNVLYNCNILNFCFFKDSLRLIVLGFLTISQNSQSELHKNRQCIYMQVLHIFCFNHFFSLDIELLNFSIVLQIIFHWCFSRLILMIFFLSFFLGKKCTIGPDIRWHNRISGRISDIQFKK